MLSGFDTDGQNCCINTAHRHLVNLSSSFVLCYRYLVNKDFHC